MVNVYVDIQVIHGAYGVHSLNPTNRTFLLGWPIFQVFLLLSSGKAFGINWVGAPFPVIVVNEGLVWHNY